MNTMPCARCDNEVDETTTRSCSLGGIDISDYLPNLEKARFVKLCMFDDLFYCNDCMDLNKLICKDCSDVLSPEEKETLKEKLA